jgi:NAD(P)-dependent dehydrogenase (short-subunit alcohol dehydrogenase family)
MAMKNILIIGASSGIGKQLARQLSDAGDQVYGTYFQHETSGEADGLQHRFLDVNAPEYDLSFLPEQLDGLVYCPGSIQLKPFARIKPADFIQDFQLQVLGAIRVIQQVLDKLKASPQASIVLFSTVAVQTGFTFHSQVATSKGAVEGLTKALAAEFAPRIRVNCIAPSITDTPLAGQLLSTPEKKEANALRHPLKKIGSPADIANVAAFLLGAESGWMTGQIIHVDGGMSALRV